MDDSSCHRHHNLSSLSSTRSPHSLPRTAYHSPPVRHCRSVTCQHRRNKTNNRALDMVAQPSKPAGSTERRRVQKRRRQRTAAAIPGPDGAAQVDDGDESSSKRKEVIDDVNGMNDLSGMSEDISSDTDSTKPPDAWRASGIEPPASPGIVPLAAEPRLTKENCPKDFLHFLDYHNGILMTLEEYRAYDFKKTDAAKRVAGMELWALCRLARGLSANGEPFEPQRKTTKRVITVAFGV